MLKKTILCSSLLFLAISPALGEGLKVQVRSMIADSRVHFKISLHDLNRIEVKNDRINQVFGKGGAFIVEQDLENGHLYLKPTPQNGRRPLSVTLTTEKGKIQDLLLTPFDVPGETLVLKEDQSSLMKRVLKLMKEEDKDFLEQEGVRGIRRVVSEGTLESDLTQTGIVLIEKREEETDPRRLAYIVEPIDAQIPVTRSQEIPFKELAGKGDRETLKTNFPEKTELNGQQTQEVSSNSVKLKIPPSTLEEGSTSIFEQTLDQPNLEKLFSQSSTPGEVS